MKSKSLLTLLLVPLMVGCGTPEASSGETSEASVSRSAEPIVFTLKDGQGRDITIDSSKTNRVICIGAGALRYYSYIGDVSKVIAVEKIDSGETFGVGQALRPYYMAGYDHFKTLPIIGQGGPMAQVADAEKLAAAQPDIIVSFLSADANTALQTTLGGNIPVVGLTQGPDGVFDDKTIKSFEVLGAVFDKEDRVEALKAYIDSCKADFANLTMTEDTYYCGGIGNWGQISMYGSMLGFPVFKYAKVKSALDDLEFKDKDGNVISKGQVTLDMEKLQAANPDHIFMDTAGINGYKADYQKEGNKAKYDALKAFTTGETYQLLPYNAYYSNLEIQLMSTYYVASVAHSDFTVDLDAKMNEITNKFLGKNMYNDIKAHTYGMGGYKKVDLKALGE